jgi:hypothetical protein
VHRWDLRDFVAELPPWPELGVALCCRLLLDLLADSQCSEPLSSSGIPNRICIIIKKRKHNLARYCFQQNFPILTSEDRHESLRGHLVFGDGDDFSDLEQELDGSRRWSLRKTPGLFSNYLVAARMSEEETEFADRMDFASTVRDKVLRTLGTLNG